MAVTITLTEDQYHILSQALAARETHLERIASSNPPMASALPLLREVRQAAGLAYTGYCANRRKYLGALATLPSSYDPRTPEGQEREATASRLFAVHYGSQRED